MRMTMEWNGILLRNVVASTRILGTAMRFFVLFFSFSALIFRRRADSSGIMSFAPSRLSHTRKENKPTASSTAKKKMKEVIAPSGHASQSWSWANLAYLGRHWLQSSVELLVSCHSAQPSGVHDSGAGHSPNVFASHDILCHPASGRKAPTVGGALQSTPGRHGSQFHSSLF